jgi:hypothetical protein
VTLRTARSRAREADLSRLHPKVPAPRSERGRQRPGSPARLSKAGPLSISSRANEKRGGPATPSTSGQDVVPIEGAARRGLRPAAGFRRLAAVTARDDLEGHLLVVLQAGQAGALDGGDVHEHVARAAVGGDEAEALGGVEPFHGASGHRDVSIERRCPRHAAARLGQRRNDKLQPVKENSGSREINVCTRRVADRASKYKATQATEGTWAGRGINASRGGRRGCPLDLSLGSLPPSVPRAQRGWAMPGPATPVGGAASAAPSTPLGGVPVPVERDVFTRPPIRKLAATLEDVVGIEEAAGHIAVVGPAAQDLDLPRELGLVLWSQPARLEMGRLRLGAGSFRLVRQRSAISPSRVFCCAADAIGARRAICCSVAPGTTRRPSHLPPEHS